MQAGRASTEAKLNHPRTHVLPFILHSVQGMTAPFLFLIKMNSPLHDLYPDLVIHRSDSDC